MTLALVVSLIFVAAGGVLLVIGGTVATAVALSLLGFAGVIWVSMAFFAVGRSEDREREASATRDAGPERPADPPRGGPVHREEERRARFRRRP
jgi:hypothetical protein